MTSPSVAEPYVYIFVRKDLPAEQQAVQAIHASIESAKHFDFPKDPPNIVLCHVKDEGSLDEHCNTMLEAGVRYQAIREPDMDYHLTAAATEPICGERRKMFRKFRLLRFAPVAQRQSVSALNGEC